MSGLIDVQDAPREIRAAVLAMKSADKDTRTAINTSVRAAMNPVWRGLVETNAASSTPLAMLAKGARIAAGNPPVLIAASSRRVWGRGLIPDQHWAGYEYGAGRRMVTYDRKSRGGGSHTVTRDVMAGHPPRRRTGRAIGPAVAEIGPRLASLWTQTIVRAFLDAADRKRN